MYPLFKLRFDATSDNVLEHYLSYQSQDSAYKPDYDHYSDLPTPNYDRRSASNPYIPYIVTINIKAIDDIAITTHSDASADASAGIVAGATAINID